MKGYIEKELVVELLQFLRSSNREEILLKDYIRITDSRIHWTKRRIQALHKAIHVTKAVTIDYVPVRVPAMDSDEITMIQCIRVRRTEVQHLNRLGAAPAEMRRNNAYQEKQKIYRIFWRDRSRAEVATRKRKAATQEKQAKRPVS